MLYFVSRTPPLAVAADIVERSYSNYNTCSTISTGSTGRSFLDHYSIATPIYPFLMRLVVHTSRHLWLLLSWTLLSYSYSFLGHSYIPVLGDSSLSTHPADAGSAFFSDTFIYVYLVTFILA